MDGLKNYFTLFGLPPFAPLAREEEALRSKPIGLWMDILDMLPDIPVLDLFSGNGTTFIACQNKNKIALGIELDTQYCAVILQRMHDAFPGLEIKRLK